LKDDSDEEADEEEEVYGGSVVKEKKEEEEEENIDTVKVGEKRQRNNEEVVDNRKIKRQRRMRFLQYYRGSFYGKSSSYIIYEMCLQMNRESKDMLWLRILGATDQVIHSKCGTYDYDDDVMKCIEEVQRLNPHIYNVNNQEQ